MKRIFLLVATASCIAATSSVSQNDISAVSVQLPRKGGTKEVSLFCFQGEAGKVKEKGSTLTFTSLSEIVKLKKKAYKKDRSSKKKKQLQNAKKLYNASLGSCETTDSPTPTPTPGNQGTQNSYFDPQGNVTALGYDVFEIPAELSANAFLGQDVFEQTCAGCHEKRTRLTFPELRERISEEPMYFTEDEVPDEDLANLFAYLAVGRSPLRE
ncbi:MAG: cytochrome c [Bdellovibrionales bacterium]|nr:cytochrome c [Bdellovibrionales bacterium]